MPARINHELKTRWLMSLLCDFSYFSFEKDRSTDQLKHFWKDVERCQWLNQKTAEIDHAYFDQLALTSPSACFKEILSEMGMPLVGKPISNIDSDIQAFVVNVDINNESSLVVVYRGSESSLDWKVNLDSALVGLDNSQHKVHRGFLRAFQSVEPWLKNIIDQYPDLPLYFTGHSMGGALAMIGACCYSTKATYTFGASKFSNKAVLGKINSPVYRFVNGPDPVPTFPFAKLSTKLVGLLFGWLNPNVSHWATVNSGYAHPKDVYFLTQIRSKDYEKGDFDELKLLRKITTWQRLSKYVKYIGRGNSKMIHWYHLSYRYKKKLEALMLRDIK